MNVAAEDIVSYLNDVKPEIHESYRDSISVIEGKGIEIKNCLINGDLNIDNSLFHLILINITSKYDLNLNSNDETFLVQIKSSNFKNINATGRYSYLTIFDGTKANSLKLQDFKSDYLLIQDFDTIENKTKTPYYQVRLKKISINNSNVRTTAIIDGQNISEEIIISQSSFGQFRLDNANFIKVMLSGIRAEKFVFQGRTTSESDIRLTYIIIKKSFKIMGFRNSGFLIIDNIKVLKDPQYKNKMKVYLERIKFWFSQKFSNRIRSLEPFIEFELTDFGNCVFKNCLFSNFETIYISYTDLAQSSTSNSLFPSNKIVLNKVNAMNVYESFNNLYSKAKSVNNRAEQAEYYKISMSALLTYNLKHNPINNLPSITTLLTSKLYSNYATNWIQGILSTLIIAFITFSSMMNLTMYDIDLSFDVKSVQNFWNLTPYYLQFLIPTHKIDFLDKAFDSNLSSSTSFLFWDLAGRILISIGIFETIKSFRKYIRN